MTCYIVSFEPAANETAEKIREHLRALSDYCPINAYCWAVKSDLTASALREQIGIGSPGARIFVIRSGTAAAWQNAYAQANSDWLKKNL
jgi:hypothetical protein